MRLTVLGNAGRYLAPLSGGSGYLVEAAGARIVLDCGSGVRDALARLGSPPPPLDAVVLSHFHHDHVADLVPVMRHLRPGGRLVVPAGERARLDRLAEAFAFEGPFEVPGGVFEAAPGASLTVGDARLRFSENRHGVACVATRVEAEGKALVYASDTAPCDALRDLAHRADLLLMHALLPTVAPDAEHARIHATAATAAALAVASGAGRLVLSHRFHESKDSDMLFEARMAKVQLARDHGVIEV